VGRIDRAHGITGAVVVRMVSNNPERLVVGTDLIIGDGPQRRTLRVTSVRPHQDRWLVELDGITSRESARQLASSLLYAPAVVDDLDSYWVHDLIGAEVVDTDGVAHGTVVEVYDNPASDVLELDGGALVPLRFATWDRTAPHGTRRLVVDGPEGLLGDQ
jgi:16S rRNA processing protein RimM